MNRAPYIWPESETKIKSIHNNKNNDDGNSNGNIGEYTTHSQPLWESTRCARELCLAAQFNQIRWQEHEYGETSSAYAPLLLNTQAQTFDSVNNKQ